MPPVFGKGLLSRLFKCQSQGMKITYKTPSWGIDPPSSPDNSPRVRKYIALQAKAIDGFHLGNPIFTLAKF